MTGLPSPDAGRVVPPTETLVPPSQETKGGGSEEIDAGAQIDPAAQEIIDTIEAKKEEGVDSAMEALASEEGDIKTKTEQETTLGDTGKEDKRKPSSTENVREATLRLEALKRGETPKEEAQNVKDDLEEEASQESLPKTLQEKVFEGRSKLMSKLQGLKFSEKVKQEPLLQATLKHMDRLAEIQDENMQIVAQKEALDLLQKIGIEIEEINDGQIAQIDTAWNKLEMRLIESGISPENAHKEVQVTKERGIGELILYGIEKKIPKWNETVFNDKDLSETEMLKKGRELGGMDWKRRSRNLLKLLAYLFGGFIISAASESVKGVEQQNR